MLSTTRFPRQRTLILTSHTDVEEGGEGLGVVAPATAVALVAAPLARRTAAARFWLASQARSDFSESSETGFRSTCSSRAHSAEEGAAAALSDARKSITVRRTVWEPSECVAVNKLHRSSALQRQLAQKCRQYAVERGWARALDAPASRNAASVALSLSPVTIITGGKARACSPLSAARSCSDPAAVR